MPHIISHQSMNKNLVIHSRDEENEFGKFTNLLDRLLSVPHSEIKAKLDAEKEKKRVSKRRASSGHASGEKG
jgi:hypothetical protein